MSTESSKRKREKVSTARRIIGQALGDTRKASDLLADAHGPESLTAEEAIIFHSLGIAMAGLDKARNILRGAE